MKFAASLSVSPNGVVSQFASETETSSQFPLTTITHADKANTFLFRLQIPAQSQA
jgi:hypothetical protein